MKLVILIMKYIEYRKSAIRHIQTCEKLLEVLDSCHTGAEKQNILFSIYYLSGYIIETSLSFVFFALIRESGEIEDSIHFKNEKFKTHNFQKKVDYINKILGKQYLRDIPIVTTTHNVKTNNILYRSWSTDFRYVNNNEKVNLKDHLGFNEVSDYFLVVKEINKKLIKIA